MPGIPIWFFLVVLVAAIVCVVAWIALFKVWRIAPERSFNPAKRIATREKMTPEMWFEKHFAALGVSQQAALAVATELEQALRCDATQVRPDDRFNNTLYASVLTHLFSRDELENARAQIERLATPGAPSVTVADIVRIYEDIAVRTHKDVNQG